MRGDALAKILTFIGSLQANDELEVVVNQLSTQVRGDLDAVMSALTGAIRNSFDAGGSQALVVKLLNADLPIGEPPVLEIR
jgi:hypothetical protein